MAITTLIGSQNLLRTATLTASDDVSNVDNLWDTFLTDFWEPATGSTVVIDNGVNGTAKIDSFTDIDSTQLINHTGESGGWSLVTGAASDAVISSNSVSFSLSAAPIFRLDKLIVSADQIVSADMTFGSTVQNVGSLYARMTDSANHYFIEVYPPASEIRLYSRTTGGGTVQIGTYAIAVTTGVAHAVALSAAGTTISVDYDGATVISVTDATISSGVYVGIGASRSGTAGTVTMDDLKVLSAPDIDYWGVVGKNLSSVVLAWSDDDISYTTIETISPTTDAVIFSTFTSVSHRYYKITVNGTGFRVARINLGVATPPAGTMQVPWVSPKHSHERQISTSVSNQGLPINNVIRYNKNPVTMTFKNVAVSWIDSTWDTLYSEIYNDMFFLLWDEAGRPTETAICNLSDDANPAWADVTYMAYTLKFNCTL